MMLGKQSRRKFLDPSDSGLMIMRFIMYLRCPRNMDKIKKVHTKSETVWNKAFMMK
jgi:hypothetical protein